MLPSLIYIKSNLLKVTVFNVYRSYQSDTHARTHARTHILLGVVQLTTTYQILLHRCCHKAVSSHGLQGGRERLWVDPWTGWTGGWRWSLAAPGSVTHNGSTQYVNIEITEWKWNYFFHMCVQQVTYVTNCSWKKETSIKYSKLCHCVITLPTLGLYRSRQSMPTSERQHQYHNNVAPSSEYPSHETPTGFSF